jgi:hypothetical protein
VLGNVAQIHLTLSRTFHLPFFRCRQIGAWEIDSLEEYTGADVSKEVIVLNKNIFRHHSIKLFMFWDFVTCVVLQLRDNANGTTEPYQLLHMRDVLQHLSLNRGRLAAGHILESGARFAIATTDPSSANENITSGGWYKANIAKEPFNFPEPLRCVATHPSHEDDRTCLYQLKG